MNVINRSRLTQKKILWNKSSSNYINKLKNKEKEERNIYDVNNEKKTIILLTHLIKDIYKKKTNELIKNETLFKQK